MSITAQCECGKKFKARDEYGGRRAICTVCRREFVFPLPSTPEQLPPLVEPNPSPSPASVVEQVSAEEKAPPQGSRPWWKDKIIVFGGGAPLLGLVVFSGYVAWPHVGQHADQDSSKPENGRCGQITVRLWLYPSGRCSGASAQSEDSRRSLLPSNGRTARSAPSSHR